VPPLFPTLRKKAAMRSTQWANFDSADSLDSNSRQRVMNSCFCSGGRREKILSAACSSFAARSVSADFA